MPLTAAALLARVRMLRMTGFLPPAPPPPPEPATVADKLKSFLRGLAGKPKES